MTAPTVTAPTTPYTIPAGGAAVRITDGNNAPAGLWIVNQGANGGTVWISSGPAGQAAAMPLGPGACLQWTDPSAVPYASQTGTSTKPETLLLTGQSQGYTNPSVVAGALVAQGIPSTFLGTQLYSAANPNGTDNYYPAFPITLQVGQYATLYLSATWYDQTNPPGPAALKLVWDHGPGLRFVQYLTFDVAQESPGGNVWAIPVNGPTVTLTNQGTPLQALGAYATNRTVAGFAQLGEEMGARNLYAFIPTAGTEYTLKLANDVNFATGTSLTRHNGAVALTVEVGGPGYLIARYIDETTTRARARIRIAGSTSIPWNHPHTPVSWSYVPDTTVAGNFAHLTVTGGA